VADGDVPGGTGTGGNATGGDGEEAVWLDLVARFGAPAPAPADGESLPWPDREDLAGPVRVTPAVGPTDGLPTDALPGEPPTNPTGLPGLPIMPGLPAMPDEIWPDLGGGIGSGGIVSGGIGSRGIGTGPRDAPLPDDPADDHYVPPVPPPLPRLDPVTKLAWIALFGGPLYLLISTAVGSTISGVAAFLAVAAFVGGFVVLVLRMDNGRPPDSGPDDGAVV
jgi:hypothetical protein